MSGVPLESEFVGTYNHLEGATFSMWKYEHQF
jgi:hypothetical protein